MGNKHVNAVIIGAGAGGGIVAKELTGAGMSVVIFERGKWYTYDELYNDELTSQRTFPLYCGYGPDNKNYRRVVPNGNGGWNVVLPNSWDYGNNAACVGGGTLSYGAMGWRFMPEDFRLKTILGNIEGSNLEDWPVRYDELEPYYEKAEYEIGVSGDDAGMRPKPPRRNKFPMPAFSYNREGNILNEAAQRLGLNPFPIPMLRNSVPYMGRPACYRFRTCVGFACPVDAKGGSQNTVLPLALKTGLCELRVECKVFEIMTDAKGKARGVKYFDEKDKHQEQTADLVIVSASATETARLLLNSKSKLFPKGLGNNNDMVGRNLQDHAYTGAVGLFNEEVYDDVGPGACIAVNDYNHTREGMTGGVLCNEFIRLPYAFTGTRPPGSKSWGIEHKNFQRDYFKKHMVVVGPVQELPRLENRVELDPEVKDGWGIPTLRMIRERHDQDLKTAEFLSSKAVEWLKEAGAIQTFNIVPGKSGSAAQHQAGTCRMGKDPLTSVTNRFGQLHEVDNVFVADGSLLVNNGGFNPALTIMTMAYWVSDYIVKQWK
jgi:choline dehydrogenase-like flavoprotein